MELLGCGGRGGRSLVVVYLIQFILVLRDVSRLQWHVCLRYHVDRSSVDNCTDQAWHLSSTHGWHWRAVVFPRWRRNLWRGGVVGVRVWLSRRLLHLWRRRLLRWLAWHPVLVDVGDLLLSNTGTVVDRPHTALKQTNPLKLNKKVHAARSFQISCRRSYVSWARLLKKTITLKAALT